MEVSGAKKNLNFFLIFIFSSLSLRLNSTTIKGLQWACFKLGFFEIRHLDRIGHFEETQEKRVKKRKIKTEAKEEKEEIDKKENLTETELSIKI